MISLVLMKINKNISVESIKNYKKTDSEAALVSERNNACLTKL